MSKSELKVRSYSGEGCFYIDLEKLSVRTSIIDSEANDSNLCSGQGAYLTTGVIKRRRSFFSLFSANGKLNLFADGTIHELNDHQIRTIRNSPFPFFRKFSIVKNGSIILQWTYLIKDLVEDEPFIGDFLWQINRIANGEKETAIFIRYWDAASKGIDPNGKQFQLDLADYLRSAFGQ